jgi:hypothetical protein
VNGACAASVVDAIGNGLGGRTFGNGAIYASNFEIFSTRTLTQIEVKLDLPTERDIIWQVYELDAETWEATLRCDATSFAPSAHDVFVSSGSLSCLLEAGKRYAIALQDTAPDLEYGGIAADLTMFPGVVAGPFPTSFARWLGSGATDANGPPPLLLTPTEVFPYTMKLTTESP